VPMDTLQRIEAAACAHFSMQPDEVWQDRASNEWTVRFVADTRCDSDDDYVAWYDEQFGDVVQVEFWVRDKEGGDVETATAFEFIRNDLKSTQNTPEMEEQIRKAAKAVFGSRPQTFFEHGQWWIRYYAQRVLNGDNDDEYEAWFVAQFGEDAEEATFSVVDQVGGDAVDGFGFEEIG
jgi:hypothetical protein